VPARPRQLPRPGNRCYRLSHRPDHKQAPGQTPTDRTLWG
jgi:hypothetical protein